MPLVTYATLPQFIYGIASTASKTFPMANSQPYNFLNLDFYAQDTWKLTRTLSWTFGVRDTYNSNPLNPHNAVARLAGSFDSISHDVNQPLSQVISDAAGNDFRRDAPQRSCSRVPPSPGNSRRTRCCGLASACSATSCRAAWSISSARILPTRRLFRAGCSARWEESAIAPGVPNSAIDATVAANQLFNSGLGERPTLLRLGSGQSELLPSADFHHCRSGRQAPCALLHAVELGNRAPNRQRA